LRFFVIGLLLWTAHRLPAPVVEGPPPFKRTFFTLKGHAVDTFANEKQLPPELAPAFTHASVLATKPLTELTDLMRKFGYVLGFAPGVLKAGADDEERTPEMQRREAAIQKIAKSQLKKIGTNPILPSAAGFGYNITFSASELPSAFFADSAWSIDVDNPDDLLTKGVKRPNPTRIEIPLYRNVRLLRYATKNDLEIMRRAKVEGEIKDSPVDALVRFYAEISRGGLPQRLLPIQVVYDEGCGGSSTVVIAYPPPLQSRVVVLENITNGPIEFGQFHFRLLDPGRGILTVRTRAENEALLASTNADSGDWYKPHMVKPGEKVIVPLELLFKPSSTRYNSGEEPETTRARRRACANKLLADRELQTVALMYEGRDRKPQGRTPLVVMPKQKFVDGLLRETGRPTDDDEFVYGPSLVLDSVDVNHFRYPIEPFDPINVAYFSGSLEGSCPFVYTRRTIEGAWLKQGTILTGCSPKAREGTRTLRVHAFDGTLRIAEEEAEISYIDELFVRGTLVNGERVTLRPTDDRIADKDFRYLVLKKGESAEIKFPVPDGMRGNSVQVVASGFFELSSPPAGQ
jgi:hypothetical protein